jgi:hypothetical protein
MDCDRDETLHHLFWTCPFADRCWDFICPQRQRNISVHEAFQDLRDKMKLPFSMEIIILASWTLWMSINNKIFRNQRPSFQGWNAIYLEELKMLAFRMKKKHKTCFDTWLRDQL